MDELLKKIEILYFEHIVDENGILQDEGEYNVPLEKNNNVRYTIIGGNDYGNRSDNEIKILKYINDSMDILSLVHMFIHQNYDQCKPMYFLPEGHNIPDGHNIPEGHNIPKNNQEKILIENDAPPDGYSNDLEVDPLSDCLKEMEL
jgi:hypothetical protein